MAEFWKIKKLDDKLKKEWEKKLKDSGFNDAEKEINGERVLIENTTANSKFGILANYKLAAEVVRENKAEYFRVLYQKFSEEKSFEDSEDRLIMERTAEGRTIKEISDELKEKLSNNRVRSKFNRNTIRYVRRRYENKWGIKKWDQADMMSRQVKKPRTP